MDKFQSSHNYIKSILNNNIVYKLGVIAGSGLGLLRDILVDIIEIKYEEIPYFASSTVKGHAGCLLFGRIGNIHTIIMLGRLHAYEGYGIDQIVYPIRIMKLMGIEQLIVTNASGGLNPGFNVGDFMIISDHVSLAGFGGQNPLVGPNLDAFGPRFPPVSSAYDFEMRVKASMAACVLNIQDTVREGVYTFVMGPSFETRAEARFLRDYCGGDCVGMSTVPEVIAAKHCGITVLGLSLITNKVSSGVGRSAMKEGQQRLGLDFTVKEASGDEMLLASHEEVLETSKARSLIFLNWVIEIIKRI